MGMKFKDMLARKKRIHSAIRLIKFMVSSERRRERRIFYMGKLAIIFEAF